MTRLPIGFESEVLRARAQALASTYGFVLTETQVFPRLNVTEDKLVLLLDLFSPLFVDFDGLRHQQRREMGKKQGLIRACKPQPGLRVLDVTAGWGRDAALLASFGAEVLMLERQPVMAALLEDALSRLTPNSLQLSLLCVDAHEYLSALTPAEYPDVIYLDPMHPVRQKSALVKKDMQALQYLFGADEDALDLLKLAIPCARQRVVVKWPQRLPPLLKPHHAISGKTVRFDVY